MCGFHVFGHLLVNILANNFISNCQVKSSLDKNKQIRLGPDDILTDYGIGLHHTQKCHIVCSQNHYHTARLESKWRITYYTTISLYQSLKHSTDTQMHRHGLHKPSYFSFKISVVAHFMMHFHLFVILEQGQAFQTSGGTSHS